MEGAPARQAAPPGGIHYPWGGARRPCRSRPDGRAEAERGARDKGRRKEGERETQRRRADGGGGRAEQGGTSAASALRR